MLRAGGWAGRGWNYYYDFLAQSLVLGAGAQTCEEEDQITGNWDL